MGQSHFVPNSAAGLRLSWFRYRGAGPVTATFSEPGMYVLRALAHDGGLLDYDDVTIQVTR